MRKMNPAFSTLSDEQIIFKGDRAVRNEHELVMAILDYLNEIEGRSIYLKEGYSSLFTFCTRRWRFSPSKAGRFIAAARCIRQFPAVRTLMARRKITVCGIAKIASLLTTKNCAMLLREVSGKMYIEIEKIAASRRTAPPVREFVRPIGKSARGGRGKQMENHELFQSDGNSMSDTGRRLSHHSQTGSDSQGGSGLLTPGSIVAMSGHSQTGSDLQGGSGLLTPGSTVAMSGHSQTGADLQGNLAPVPSASPAEKQEQRYEIRFSASERFLRKLERARCVCSRRSNLEAILEKGLDELLERFDPEQKEARREKRKIRKLHRHKAGESVPARSDRGQNRVAPAIQFSEEPASDVTRKSRGRSALRSSPDPGDRSASANANGTEGDRPIKGRSRNIPAGIRDAVFTRDGGRCTFVGQAGVRCDSTAHLQIDHKKPFCLGGEHTIENLRLLCGKHNRWVAREMALSP